MWLTGPQGVEGPESEGVGGAGHQVSHQEGGGLAVLGEDLLPGGRHRHHDLQAGVFALLHWAGTQHLTREKTSNKNIWL